MPGPHVCLCHRNRLMSECLATALNEAGNLDCRVVLSETLLAPPAPLATNVVIDLLLLDATLEGDLSIQIADRVRSLHPTCKVVLLIAEHAVGRMLELAQMGCHACVFEGLGLADFIVAIQTVLSGQQYCSPQLANALLSQVGGADRNQEWSRQWDEAHLTSREREVLELIACQQLGNKQIARQLGLSLYTVKNHVHNILEKLGVQDRHEAVQLARRRRLVVGERPEPRDTVSVRFSR